MFEFLYYVFLLIIFQKFNCSILSQIAGPIFGALIGAFAACLLSYMNSQNEFNNNKEGVNAILKSEIKLLIKSLIKYKDNYLSNEISENNYHEYKSTLKCFYYNNKYFPKYYFDSWTKLIKFIPSIFTKEQIDNIMEFYDLFNNLVVRSEFLYDHYNNSKRFHFSDEEYFKIFKRRERLILCIDEVIEKGNSILEYFE